MKSNQIKNIVKKHYSQAINNGSCCSSCSCDINKEEISKSIGYSNVEIQSFSEANLGFGCGNPVGMAKIKEGDIVLDLGSGAGFDAFLASKKVGSAGKVIGIDMTKEMIEKAKSNAKKYGYKNVKFKLGDIENLPIDDNSIDIIISNCVINLAPNKLKVFKEAYRVLKNGGRIYLSDIVLLKELSKEERQNENLIAGCVGGALLKKDYLDKIQQAGFNYKILSEDKDISQKQYNNIPLESLKLEAIK